VRRSPLIGTTPSSSGSELYVPARAIVAINAIQVQIFLISKWTKKMQSP